MNTNSDIIINYHRQTKHSLERYAKSPESLDWDDQPNVFREFEGCPLIKLPKTGAECEPLFSELDKQREAEVLSKVSIGLLLELAFGLSAWKEFGVDRWSLRCNPSSGNLHPTEVYLINTDKKLFATGSYHYQVYEHVLEQRCIFNEPLENAGIFIGFSSVHWREAWKYGERAFRYCQHDIGHALGSLRYAAAVLGWKIELITQCSDEQLSGLLGLNRDEDFKTNEREYPDILCKIHTQHNETLCDLDSLYQTANRGTWSGAAKSLHQYHLYKWTVIDEVTKATEKPCTEPIKNQLVVQIMGESTCQQAASSLIRQRRSAQHFNPKAMLAKKDFYHLLGATLPNRLPFDLWTLDSHLHLFIFVHRVEDLETGLYALPRNNEKLPKLKTATAQEFEWKLVSDAPIPLYRLLNGNCRTLAKTLSCHQAIASDSAFSLAMVAEFSSVIKNAAWQYRYLFWEAGLIGQVLYLQAEAAGVRGTGIGCYFDDSVHEILGIKNEDFQSVYHFTVGTPLEDSRLQTLPAYGHLV